MYRPTTKTYKSILSQNYYFTGHKGFDDECLFVCPHKGDPVCDSAHQTHKNECFLCRTACIRPDRRLVKLCDGPCPCGKGAAEKEWVESHRIAKEKALKEKTFEDIGFEKHNEPFKRKEKLFKKNEKLFERKEEL